MLQQAEAERLRAIRCFLLDMDGTFYLGDRLLEGSLDFLDALAKTGRQALFLTNNSSKSADAYLQKLRRMGVPEPFLRVFTSGQAAGRYALKAFPGRRAYVLGNEALCAELRGMGIAIDDERPDYVLIGYDTTLTYAKMTRVCDLVRAGLPYIATHPDFNCPTETGFAPDIGAIIAFIEASTGRRPDRILGKPHSGIVEGALEITGASVAETAMVGDRLYTDIATGVRFGMTAILVLTGEATRADIETSPAKPHLVMNRLSDMIPYLL
ncbi:MAG: HAD-IIA family hydrolase [Oscillospiraceae bacterium]|jgi:HAD superfamily hydrolase (TIGR01457 family)|nr:HAD-IIA family hydrolase [Oscillospiraceae bacterium]